MSPAIPAKLVACPAPGDGTAVADLHGHRLPISTALLPDARAGDWVLVHAGFATGRLEDIARLAEPLPPRQAFDSCPTGRELRFIDLCGTRTFNAWRSGLYGLMPGNVALISGPGCSVCATSQAEVDQLVELARRPNLTLCTFTPMLRVPGRQGSLESARINGADVRAVHSPLEALRLAVERPDRQILFAAVGFESMAPATAFTILEARRLWLGNFTVYASHKCVLSGVRALLDQQMRVDGLLCPAEVAVIMGAEYFRPIVRQYALSCVIAGCDAPQFAAALARLCELTRPGHAALENLYPQAVTPQGNPTAQALMTQVFRPGTVHWRGLGDVQEGGLELREEFRRFDARVRFELRASEGRESPGSRCGDIVAGRCTPRECGLFAGACTPARPVGPCMVSPVGVCQAWFKYGPQEKRAAPKEIAGTRGAQIGVAS